VVSPTNRTRSSVAGVSSRGGRGGGGIGSGMGGIDSNLWLTLI